MLPTTNPRILPLTVSTQLVPRILDNSKTMTRRLLKPYYQENTSCFKKGPGFGFCKSSETGSIMGGIECPYAKGDILYIREEHYAFGEWKIIPGTSTKYRKAEKSRFIPKERGPGHLNYSFSHPICVASRRWVEGPAWHKRLARFMPKKYARTFLEVIDIKVELLQDISPHDAGDEGVEFWNVDAEAFEGGELVADYKNYTWRDDPTYKDYHFSHYANPVDSFISLWESIHGEGSWERDRLKWVWVITFKRSTKPANFPS